MEITQKHFNHARFKERTIQFALFLRKATNEGVNI